MRLHVANRSQTGNRVTLRSFGTLFPWSTKRSTRVGLSLSADFHDDSGRVVVVTTASHPPLYGHPHHLLEPFGPANVTHGGSQLPEGGRDDDHPPSPLMVNQVTFLSLLCGTILRTLVAKEIEVFIETRYMESIK